MTVAELSRILSGVSLSAFAQIALKVGMASPRGQQLLQSPVAQMPVQKSNFTRSSVRQRRRSFF